MSVKKQENREKTTTKRERPEINKEVNEVKEERDLEVFEEEREEELRDETDAIELEEDEAEKITYGATFSPQEGDLGEEPQDIGDLPESLIKNRYDPTLLSQPTDEPDNDELIEKIRITNEDKAGLGYGDNDYTDED